MTEEQLGDVNKALDNIGVENVQNIIIISNEATNGEVIELLFTDVGTNFSNVIDLNLWWNAKYRSTNEIRCNCTDKEIAKSFIDDLETVKDLLPQLESEQLESELENPFNDSRFGG